MTHMTKQRTDSEVPCGTPVDRHVRPLVARMRLHADNKTKQAMQRDGQQAADLIETLDAWIEEEGERYDVCTRSILGRVCNHCRCGRAA